MFNVSVSLFLGTVPPSLHENVNDTCDVCLASDDLCVGFPEIMGPFWRPLFWKLPFNEDDNQGVLEDGVRYEAVNVELTLRTLTSNTS